MNINLEQAKRLWELGVEKEAYFMWRSYNGKAELWKFNRTMYITPVMNVWFYPAYNAEELIKLLRSKEHIPIEIYSHGDGFMFHNDRLSTSSKGDIYGTTLTEALANKLIYDIENGIITVEEINK